MAEKNEDAKFEADLEAKLKLLTFTRDKTGSIIEGSNTLAMDRQLKALNTLVDEVDMLRRCVEQNKFKKGEEPESVATWGKNLDGEVSKTDAAITTLTSAISEVRSNQILKERQLEHALREKEREEQLLFEKRQFEQKIELEQRLEEAKKSKGQAYESKPPNTRIHSKLPELKITKFNGNASNWLTFWNKFEAEIDKADLAPTTKFAYLKEMLDPGIRTEVDGLPFTSEGYERAKTILQSEYGRQSEIVNAYIQNIMNLPVITGSQPSRVHEFYKTLLFNVQSLETLGKLQDVKGNVRCVIDKLKGIKSDLVRGQSGWQDWDFPQLVQALKRWKDINPIEPSDDKKRLPGVSRHFQTGNRPPQPGVCVYCNSETHKSIGCDKVTTIDDRRKHLARNRLCFNCTRGQHRAADCKSNSACHKCQRKHHTSICDQRGNPLMTASCDGNRSVCYPVVVVEVNGIKCRALLDTGAGSSYASSALINEIKIKPEKVERRRIEMMIGSVTKTIEMYRICVKNLAGDFSLQMQVSKVDREKLLLLENPRYAEVIAKYNHLRGVEMLDKDQKPELPVHLVIGTNEYTQIKTESTPRIGRPGEPIAEKTKFGWTIMSPGKEVNVNEMFLTQTCSADYESLCRLDVLGLQDSPTGDQGEIHKEFQEQLRRSPDGWYETGLPWKGNHPPLSNNKSGSLKRLESLTRKLERLDLMEKYDKVIKDQLEQGIVERADENPTGREFYIPHKPVVRESAESTKLRVVYDASARDREGSPSLNECLNPGPPLQNQLWNVLVRARFHPVLITGDLKQAFLQVRIHEQDRDALRFHWLKDLRTKEIEVLRFTRALFGLAPSPFLLGGVIQHHLENYRTVYPEIVSEIEKSLYVDDLISGGENVKSAGKLKNKATEIFANATFTLHKWHSNVRELESSDKVNPEVLETFAKQQLGIPNGEEASILGLPWKKKEDTIGVKFPPGPAEPTKRGILGKVARIYDPLGLVAPMTLTGKLLYRDACNAKLAWDAKLPNELLQRLIKWEKELPTSAMTKRSLPLHQEEILEIHLHSFGDASGKGVAAVVYAVVFQPEGVSQGLVAAKSRLAKQGLTIPRLELVSGHMAVNLITNVKIALKGFNVTRQLCWLDSSVALHWIRGNGSYRQFVANRVEKIQEHTAVEWRHVNTEENPADLASRGGSVGDKDSWWNGPTWLKDMEEWPPEIATSTSPESKVEEKILREVFKLTQAERDHFDVLADKFQFWKLVRVCAWVKRFINNTRKSKKKRVLGLLGADEIEVQVKFWIKRAQGSSKFSENFERDQLQLNLQPNNEGILECRGRIQGQYPIYLPDSHPFTVKIVTEAHQRTLHGGMGATMACVRESYWVPRLRRLTKKIIKTCNGCYRFQAKAYAAPPPGRLPTDRTEGSEAFEVVGLDFAGPIKYRRSKSQEGKAYIVVYACSLTRALYLEVLTSMETVEFLQSLKRFIARRGRPRKIYSDNGRTFVAAAKWLRAVMKDERVSNLLVTEGIQWQFNLSRAPWWGGQFERMIGLIKQSMYKTIGNGFLSLEELREVILEVEVALNNRPLSYVEEDIQYPVLTPNSLLYGRTNLLPELEPHRVERQDLRKRAKHLRRCKEALWRRWTGEYLRGLREHHNLKHGGKLSTPKVGEIVIVKSDAKNRGKWKMGVIERIIPGIDGVVRVAKVRIGETTLERPVQHLFPLELTCDTTAREDRATLNANVPEFKPREKRRAAVEATDKIAAIRVVEEDNN